MGCASTRYTIRVNGTRKFLVGLRWQIYLTMWGALWLWQGSFLFIKKEVTMVSAVKFVEPNMHSCVRPHERSAIWDFRALPESNPRIPECTPLMVFLGVEKYTFLLFSWHFQFYLLGLAWLGASPPSFLLSSSTNKSCACEFASYPILYL